MEKVASAKRTDTGPAAGGALEHGPAHRARGSAGSAQVASLQARIDQSSLIRRQHDLLHAHTKGEGSPRSSSPSSAAQPVQRKVGFEFEMGAIQTERWNFWLRQWGDHQKGAVLATRPTYKLTADEGAGQSQLEVIIDHIDETDPLAVNTLVNNTGPAVVNDINAIAAGAFAAPMQADLIPGLAGGSSWDRYSSMANGGAGIGGQLQMTGGIAMNKLYDHVSGTQAQNYLATLNPLVNQDDQAAHGTLAHYDGPLAGNGPIAAQAMGFVQGIGALAPLPNADQQQIAAIATLMAVIPINARLAGAIPYPKAAAGPMLMRTDFAQVLVGLSPAAINALTTVFMQQIVLNTVNAIVGGGVLGTDPVMPNNGMLQGPQVDQLDIDTWVAGVMPTPGFLWGFYKGTDQFTKKSFPGSRAQRGALESLGGYGSKVDPGNKPIAEFRTLNIVSVGELIGQLERLIGFVNHP